MQLLGAVGATVLLSALLICVYAWHLQRTVINTFEGWRWAIPARVYARPLELYPDKQLPAEQLERELQLAGYRKDTTASAPGSYARQGNEFRISTREFDFGDERTPTLHLVLRLADERVVGMLDGATGDPIDLARIDPPLIGSFLPQENEDRLLLKREDLPALFVQALLAVEDRQFYSHHGIDPLAILRAAWQNVRAGAAEQGGSTLTQQLVKNFFLGNERTLRRKFSEAVMALLLDWQYDKDDILTAYANEIFLGQDGNRAIHGFGLASRFYFRRSLDQLEPQQVALLVGIVKGPSFYDPRRHPERCRQRRQHVLQIMQESGIITSDEFRLASGAPLLETNMDHGAFNRFPEFLTLVRRQLQHDYREEDLTSNGLKIFTTLDPQVQWTAEESLAASLTEVEKPNRQGLEGAVIVTNRSTGEIEAVVGSRSPGGSGFNRALDARRPVGSLLKPAVYLAALENGLTPADIIDDTPVAWKNQDGSTWSPRNYDRKEHGQVRLYEALINSYNLATVQLGLTIGMDKVIDVLKRLGCDKDLQPYPSLLLGALDMSPLEVTQLYQTLAGEGFYTPLRAIQQVVDIDNRPLQRFPLSVEQRVDPEHAFLINILLQMVVREGTASSLSRYIPQSSTLAGKTGTSDDGRDSWFAGFSGDRLAVVWVGRDDNSPAGLTGASGALVVWGNMMRQLHAQPLQLIEPPNIQWQRVTRRSSPEDAAWSGDVLLPFVSGSQTSPAAIQSSQPQANPGEKIKNAFSRLLDQLF